MELAPTSADERVDLHAGDLGAVLERGTLRWITLGGTEVVRAIYGAVRDRDWGTASPRFTAYEVTQGDDRFAIRFEIVATTEDIDFAWVGEINGFVDGLRFAMRGEARRSFLINRIGLCVLHPDTLAGGPVTVTTPFGIIRGHFPELIAAVPPFSNIEAISHPFANGRVELRFSGDLFEMEDQRNWTDASFKTFSTPLNLRAQRLVETGTVIEQEINATFTRRRGGTRRRATPDVPAITVLPEGVGSAPEIGVLAGSSTAGLGPVAVDRLRAMDLSHIRVAIDVEGASAEERLAEQLADAVSLALPIELELSTDAGGHGVEAVLSAVAGSGQQLTRILVFDRVSYTTTRQQLAVTRAAAARLDVGATIGGGTRADFAELNQPTVPIDALDVIAYRITPQVHAFDDDSVLETVAGQAATVRSARVLGGGRPIAVGPVTLRQLFNPVASDPQRAVLPTDATEDPRQATLLGAAWTVGSIAALGVEGVTSITAHATHGPAGVVADDGGAEGGHVRPLYHALADLSVPLPAVRLAVSQVPGLAAFALAWSAGRRLVVANLTREPRRFEARPTAGGELRVRVLDQRGLPMAIRRPERFRVEAWEHVASSDSVRMTLDPHSIATIDQSITD
jgi:hypothetical protein